MKKYFIIAVAACAALASCTKVESVEAPDQAISFEVANYMAQTKGQTSLITEGYTQFTTNAYFHTGTAAAQQLMDDETVAVNSAHTEWAPTSRTYYWPKSGYINFFSYAGTQNPDTKAENSLIYSNKTIVSTDNILVADAAYKYTANASTYHIDNANVKGVPTLFRHMLCKVAFTVAAKQVTDGLTPATTWDITVGSASLVVANKGTLTLSNTEAAATGIKSWSNANTAHANVGWVAASGSETINMSAISTPLTTTATTLLASRTVMPQVLTDDVVFSITYTIVTKYDGVEQISETLTENVALTDFTSAISEWDMNKKITYAVTINPYSDQKITFDPAVEDWETVSGGNKEIGA